MEHLYPPQPLFLSFQQQLTHFYSNKHDGFTLSLMQVRLCYPTWFIQNNGCQYTMNYPFLNVLCTVYQDVHCTWWAFTRFNTCLILGAINNETSLKTTKPKMKYLRFVLNIHVVVDIFAIKPLDHISIGRDWWYRYACYESTKINNSAFAWSSEKYGGDHRRKQHVLNHILSFYFL